MPSLATKIKPKSKQREPTIQRAGLRVSKSGDRLEQEAEQVARQVTSNEGPADISRVHSPSDEMQAQCAGCQTVSRVCEACEASDKTLGSAEPDSEPLSISRMSDADVDAQTQASESTPQVTPQLANRIRNMEGKGDPLTPELRSYFEPRFGADFSNVRIHTDSESEQANKELDAIAFTMGQNISFSQGRYNPRSIQGKQLIAHELTHTIQQSEAVGIDRSLKKNPLDRPRESKADSISIETDIAKRASPINVGKVSPLTVSRQPEPKAIDSSVASDFERINDILSQARQKFPRFAQSLKMVTFRSILMPDRAIIKIDGDPKTHVFPIKPVAMTQGFFAFKWDSNGNVIGLINLETGKAENRPKAGALAGRLELLALRQNRIGAVWVKQTIEKKEPKPTSASALELPLITFEVDDGTAKWFLEQNPPRPMSISGLTGGVFYPDHKGEGGKRGFYGRPLNFTYHTNNGYDSLVSRKLVGRDFWYLVPIKEISDYLRFYPIIYAGTSARGAAILAQIMVDIGMSFVPVIGPLWALFQVSQQAYHAYKNWDRMSGWEKGLISVTVLLHAIPIVRTGAKIARGTAAFNKGVKSLVASGVSRADAHRLMLMAGVFQSNKAALSIVDNLGDALRHGRRLTAAELKMVENVFHLMLQKLPAAERAVISASFATRNLETARQFLHGVELTPKQLMGLKRLAPEVLISLRRAARTEPILVQRLAVWASRSDEIAIGMNKLQNITKMEHLTKVLTEAGEDVLIQIGRGTIAIGDDLAAFVRRARSASKAYTRLMQGKTTGKTKIPGLNSLLSGSRATKLSSALSEIEKRFSKTFLTTKQLRGLSNLDETTLKALASASDSQLRAIGSMAEKSIFTAKAINHMASKLKTSQLPEIVYNIGSGLLETMGRMGLHLSDDLVRAATRKLTPFQKRKVILEGAKTKAGHIKGLLDNIAAGTRSKKGLELVLKRLDYSAHQAGIFAKWALLNPKLLEGATTILRHRPKDAQQIIAKIYQAFPGNGAGIMKSLAQAENMYGKNINFGRLIGELGAGGEKAMGSSFVLEFIVKRNLGTITSFEHSVKVGKGTRVYDILANGISYEFKFWLGFGGKPARSAANQFAKGVILHAGTHFKNLRWVIAHQSQTNLIAIESMMRGVLARPWVRTALKRQGISPKEALKRLEIALDSGLIQFF
ncbi:hypothetical protein D3OALGA1CA_4398 [Olavius algarvensis associated proteobacterium Delta 3]|nr:hypothetical protein D3OALGA1CA_4398 [Olavius algarvensis associated proteobacterium Delta 3]